MIIIEHLSKSYDNKTVVFNNFSYTFSSNLTAVIGPNGSGKTTILNCITNYIRYSGKIKTSGEISYLPEIRFFDPDVKVKDLINLFCKFYGTIDTEYTKRLTLTPFLDKNIGDLSKGNKTKLYIICTLVKPADIYIFDEPTDGLDIDAKNQFIKFCLDLSSKYQVIISTHDLGVIDRLKQSVTILDLKNEKIT